MRIALYTRGFPPSTGGMERFAQELCSWLSARGHDVAVITRTGGEKPEVDGGYRVFRQPSAARINRLLRGCDVVHVNGLSLRGIWAALTAGKRPVVTHQGHQGVCPTGLAWQREGTCDAIGRSGPCSVCPGAGVRGRLDVSLHRVGAGAAAVNVPVSRYLADRLSLPRTTVIYNPLPQRLFDPDPPQAAHGHRVAFAGRLVAEKGLDLLLRAIARLPDVELAVAGDGPMGGAWRSLSEELGVSRGVQFLGGIEFEQVIKLYRDATLVSVPSVWDEPFGYSVAEAMALGRPIVATPRGAFPELLAEGRGFVADACTPTSLAEEIRRALDDLVARDRAGTAARQFACRELHIDALGPHYEAIYERAAA